MLTFRKILYEMSPQTIEPLDTEKYKKGIIDYYNKNKEKFRSTDTEFLLKSGNDHNGYYIFVKDDIIDYFVRYKSISYENLLEGRMLRQVLVQRFKHTFESAGIPKKVFFNYLLPTFGTIVTDTEQTSDGRKFWENAIADALENPSKYEVLLIDKRKSDKKVVKIKTKSQFSSLVDDIWGSKECFKYVLVAITLK